MKVREDCCRINLLMACDVSLWQAGEWCSRDTACLKSGWTQVQVNRCPTSWTSSGKGPSIIPE